MIQRFLLSYCKKVIVGTVITRSPISNIASAMKDFMLAISLFERTAPHSSRAKIALGVLLKLREKANRTYTQHSSNVSPVSPSSSTTSIDIFDTDDDGIEDDLAIFGGQTRVLDRKGKQSQPQTPPQPSLNQPPPNLQSNNPLPKSPFSYGYLQPQHPGSSSGSSPGSSVELDHPQVNVNPSLTGYLEHEQVRTPGPQNVIPLAGGDGGRFFPTRLESQTSGHLIPQSTNLIDRREYGGRAGMSRSMAGLSQNPGMNPLGSEGYFNTSQVQLRPAPGGYRNPPLSNTNVLGGYPNPGYGYGNPSSDNTNHMVPVNIRSVPMGGRAADVDAAGYVPTYTFRTSGGMHAMDPAAAEMSLSSETGMDAGWLTFMRDCGIMDVTEDR